MAKTGKDKLGTNMKFWCYKSDREAMEAIAARMGLDDRHGRSPGQSSVHAVIKALARGELIVISLKDMDLDSACKTAYRVQRTMSSINRDLALPLRRLHASLALAKRLRRRFEHSSKSYHIEPKEPEATAPED